MEKYFRIDKENDITIVTFVFSELSPHETEELRMKLHALISEERNKFIVDMHLCSFIPSMVLGVLITFNAQARIKKGKAVFCRLTSQLKTIFHVTKLTQICEIYDTKEDAMKIFS